MAGDCYIQHDKDVAPGRSSAPGSGEGYETTQEDPAACCALCQNPLTGTGTGKCTHFVFKPSTSTCWILKMNSWYVDDEPNNSVPADDRIFGQVWGSGP